MAVKGGVGGKREEGKRKKRREKRRKVGRVSCFLYVRGQFDFCGRKETR